MGEMPKFSKPNENHCGKLSVFGKNPLSRNLMENNLKEMSNFTVYLIEQSYIHLGKHHLKS
jgi:hypothetical protein